MSLTDWCNNGWLVEHRATAQDIAELLDLADRDIQDARLSGLSEDWRLNISYNAALQLARAALAAGGFRPARGASSHYYTIQSLEYTIKEDASVIQILDRFRRKRNVVEYESAGTVSHLEAEEMLDLAKAMRGKVKDWLAREHPNLLEDGG